MIKLVLLDRDGVLNVDSPNSVRSPEELELLPNVGRAVYQLNKLGIPVVVVTNQAIVGRGDISINVLNNIHVRLKQLLSLSNAQLDDIIVCTDSIPSKRRKPNSGMLMEAINKYNVDPKETIMIGDDLRDLEAAYKIRCNRILVLTGKGDRVKSDGIPEYLLPVKVYDDLFSAVSDLLI